MRDELPSIGCCFVSKRLIKDGEETLVIWSCGVQDELQQTNLELESFKEKIKENQENIKLNKQLPYLLGYIVEVGVTSCSVLGFLLSC